jgi:renalase
LTIGHETNVAIIGMGMCGITAVREITQQHPKSWLGLDKGRSIGGRLATRRLNNLTFDHGAQFFTVRSSEFSVVVEELIAAGSVQTWCKGFHDGNQIHNDGHPRYATIGGMNRLAKTLAKELSPAQILLNKQVLTLRKDAHRWLISCADGSTILAKYVIVTAPVPQVLDLLEHLEVFSSNEDVRLALLSIEYDPCIAFMAQYRPDSIPNIATPYQLNQGPVAFVSDNGLKGVCTQPGSLTVHLSADASKNLFTSSAEDVISFVQESLRKIFTDFDFVAVSEPSVHRWRYASPKNTLDVPFVELPLQNGDTDQGARLFIAGEAFGGPKIEGAYLSGLRVGTRVVELLTADSKVSLNA